MGVAAKALALVGASAIALVAAPAAQAAFPGTNGPIVYSVGVQIPPNPEDLGSPAQVFNVPPSGGTPTQLTHVGADQTAAMPDVSANGQKIVYESNESGSYEIWSMNVDGSGQTQLTHSNGAEAFQPSWSPDGQRIAFSKCPEPVGFPAFCDIAVMNANGTGVKSLVGGRRNNLRPQFSPDGKTIAFQSDRAGFLSAVWRVGADGSKLKRLTAPRLEGFWPDWAPNGQRILFSDNWDRPNSSLWTVGANGKGAKRISHSRTADRGFAAYSPDGKRIVYSHDRGAGSQLFTANADGSSPEKLAGPTGDGAPFSADWGAAP